jgi:hypothetical protein
MGAVPSVHTSGGEFSCVYTSKGKFYSSHTVPYSTVQSRERSGLAYGPVGPEANITTLCLETADRQLHGVWRQMTDNGYGIL